MSEWPKEEAPPDSSIGSGNETLQQQKHRIHSTPVPPSHHGSQSISAAPSSTSPTLRPWFAGNARAVELPPLPQALSVSGASFSPASRSVGVPSILNPAEPDEASGRRRKASQLESPSSATPLLPPMATSTHAPQGINAAGSSASTHAIGPFGERPPRRILTPRSPSLHRAVSLNQLNPPSGTLSAQETPFLVSPRSRTYTVDPGTAGAPPLPALSTAYRSSHAFPAPTPFHSGGRRASLGATRGMRPTSESTSPRSSYSSYSQAGQPSPVAQAATSSMPTLSAAYPDSATGGPGSAAATMSGDSDRQHHVGGPVASAGGQNVFQMLTIETTSGAVQLPVDVQAASRVADEKRRRNAGASARFRQRRKEKEKESSTSIARLEQQVKELNEDVDFYRHERDSLVGVLLAIPGGERHFPRPQSPRLRRNASLSRHPGGGSVGFATVQDSGAASPDDIRRVRRRTSTLSLPPPGPAQAQAQMPAPGQGYPSSYGPQTYGHPLAPQPPQPPSHQSGASLPSPLSRGSLPPPLMQASPQTGPWNPYAERRPLGGLPLSDQSRENR